MIEPLIKPLDNPHHCAICDGEIDRGSYFGFTVTRNTIEDRRKSNGEPIKAVCIKEYGYGFICNECGIKLKNLTLDSYGH